MARVPLPGSRPMEDSILVVATDFEEALACQPQGLWVSGVNDALHRAALAIEGRLDAVIRQIADQSTNQLLLRNFSKLESDLKELLLAVWEARRVALTKREASLPELSGLARRLRKAGEAEFDLAYRAAFQPDTDTSL